MERLTGMMMEFSFLTVAMGAFCGPFYMLNENDGHLCRAGYLVFTKHLNTMRVPLIRDKKDNERDQEFLQSE